MKQIQGRYGTYDSWDDMAQAESEGWLVVATMRYAVDPGRTFPVVYGPFRTKDEAAVARDSVQTRDRATVEGLKITPLWGSTEAGVEVCDYCNRLSGEWVACVADSVTTCNRHCRSAHLDRCGACVAAMAGDN